MKANEYSNSLGFFSKSYSAVISLIDCICAIFTIPGTTQHNLLNTTQIRLRLAALPIQNDFRFHHPRRHTPRRRVYIMIKPQRTPLPHQDARFFAKEVIMQEVAADGTELLLEKCPSSTVV